MIHSKKLEETLLWQIYQGKCASDDKRRVWVKDIFEKAVEYLSRVVQTIPNYTLHDGAHILNVLDAMGGILGNQAHSLTVGEAELLILTACLHDIGMVYTEEEKQRWLEDKTAREEFLKTYYPDAFGSAPEEWSEEIRQWYFRILHPFRISEVLAHEEWKKTFVDRPLDVAPMQCILAICQAHGEEPERLRTDSDLEYLSASDVDPLFCALMLRLGDLLDFDDTRAPRILYHYAVCSEKSREEWDKHQASAGFRYPETPSLNDLPYKARCTNPKIEHTVREFLDWIDDELNNSAKLQKYCRPGWRQAFPFPRAILRDEIESDGYMSGDFCLTMDQTRILDLLIGENLYGSRDVFVRELLQNAIDATMLRGKMDSDFVPENSRIDLWEWNDEAGNVWFRIDDRGIGMTLGMLQRYFLRVGNSYYNSKELERDLLEHRQTTNYHGVSQFGIGFLSCFLNGDLAEVSTLYFDSAKNQRENAVLGDPKMQRYGLRMKVTGLNGYYVIKNQAKHHSVEEQMPGPDWEEMRREECLERNGYRACPGTSIAVCLNPGKLGILNLRKSAEEYLCGSRVPVYYNNKRIGLTYDEVMQAFHEMEGRNLCELTPEMKEEFDRRFPEVRGQYPMLDILVAALDSQENQVLPGLSGGVIKYGVHFDKVPQWRVKDQVYEVNVTTHPSDEGRMIAISSYNIKKAWRENYIDLWSGVTVNFEPAKVEALKAAFEKCTVCPETGDQLGEAWIPFVGYIDLYTAWRGYHDCYNKREMRISVTECECKNIRVLFNDNRREKVMCSYQGIVAGDMRWSLFWTGPAENYTAMFLLENEWRPEMNISRSEVKDLPLKVWIAVHGIISKYQMLDEKKIYPIELKKRNDMSLREWREVRTPRIRQWLQENLGEFFDKIMRKLEMPLLPGDLDGGYINLSAHDPYSGIVLLYAYLMADLQDNWQMTINFEAGETISFVRKGAENRSEFDLFSPMMFCRAATDQSRQYICSENYFERRGLTMDHPFIVWLLDNAPKLNQYYKRQFEQIIQCLRHYHGFEIISVCNNIRAQMLAFHDHHGVDVEAFPRLSAADFWESERNKGI